VFGAVSVASVGFIRRMSDTRLFAAVEPQQPEAAADLDRKRIRLTGIS
jgi:hypothetical protein